MRQGAAKVVGGREGGEGELGAVAAAAPVPLGEGEGVVRGLGGVEAGAAEGWEREPLREEGRAGGEAAWGEEVVSAEGRVEEGGEGGRLEEGC